MALRVKVCRIGDVPVGEMRGFDVPGVTLPILVANLGATHVATASLCPHEDVSLLDGECTGSSVICPGHSYEFDLRTGRCTHDPALELPRYRVTIVDGEVWVDLV